MGSVQPHAAGECRHDAAQSRQQRSARQHQKALGSPMPAVLVLHSGRPVVIGMAIGLIKLQDLVVVGHCSPILAQLGQAVASVVVQTHLHMHISVRCSTGRPTLATYRHGQEMHHLQVAPRTHTQALRQMQCREQHPGSKRSGEWMYYLTVRPHSQWYRQAQHLTQSFRDKFYMQASKDVLAEHRCCSRCRPPEDSSTWDLTCCLHSDAHDRSGAHPDSPGRIASAAPLAWVEAGQTWVITHRQRIMQGQQQRLAASPCQG